MTTPSFTLGIEEEYHLVDLKTRDVASAPSALMEACEAALGKQVAPEFFRSQIEVGTSVCRNFADARRELAHLRTTIAREAAAFGLAPIAASTHPFAEKSALETTPKERYQAATQACVADARSWPNDVKHEAAGWMRVDVKDVPAVFCKRAIAGVASGRITKKDLASLRLGGSSSLWRVLRG